MNEMPLENSARKGYSRIGLALFVMIAADNAAQLAAVIVANLFGFAEEDWVIWFYSEVPLCLVAIPLGYLLLRRVESAGINGEALGAKGFFKYLFMCFPLLYAGNILGVVLSMVFTGGAAENPIESILNDQTVMKVLIVVILGPIVEELVFRKFLIDRTLRFGHRTAVLFSAGTFALFHLNLFQFFYAFGVGIVFAHVYAKTGKLRYNALMHICVNFVGGVIAPAFYSFLSADNVPPLASLAASLGFLAFIFAVVGAGLAMLTNFGKELLQKDEDEAGFKKAWLNVGMILFVVMCIGLTAFILFS